MLLLMVIIGPVGSTAPRRKRGGVRTGGPNLELLNSDAPSLRSRESFSATPPRLISNVGKMPLLRFARSRKACRAPRSVILARAAHRLEAGLAKFSQSIDYESAVIREPRCGAVHLLNNNRASLVGRQTLPHLVPSDDNLRGVADYAGQTTRVFPKAKRAQLLNQGIGHRFSLLLVALVCSPAFTLACCPARERRGRRRPARRSRRRW